MDVCTHGQARPARRNTVSQVPPSPFPPSFLGPRGPLGTPSFVRSSVRPPARPQEKPKSPLKPYKSSKDHARPLI